MARPRKGHRVLGPYKHGRKWRIFMCEPGGQREVEVFGSESAARKRAAELRRGIPGRLTMDIMMDLYRKHMESKGNRGRSVDTTIMRLSNWHDPDVSIADVTPAKLQRRYDERCSEVAVDTQRGELNQVKTFWRWCVSRGYVTRSPAERIRPIGRRRRGKPQLRKSEARRFFETVELRARAGDEGALAVLVVMLLGLRSSELLARQVRDVDVTEQVILWIDEGKTRESTRFHEVPPPAGDLLAERVAGRPPDDWLFPGRFRGEHRGKDWLLRAVKRLCREAELPQITAHGLRGTWATVTTEAGALGQLVSKELGHADQEVTKRHYTEPGADARARTRRMLRVVQGGKIGSET